MTFDRSRSSIARDDASPPAVIEAKGNFRHHVAMSPRRVVLTLAVWALLIAAALVPVIEWKKSSGMTREQFLEQVR